VSTLSSLGTALAGMGGVVVGVLGAVCFVPGLLHEKREQAPASAAVHEATPARAPVGDRKSAADDARVNALEQRLAALEQRPLAASPSGALPMTDVPKDTESAVAEERATFQAALDAHELEPRNTPWGNRAGRSFAEDLGKLSQQGKFSFNRVDCRASTCTADIDWSSEAEARAGWHSLLTYDYGVNCQRNVLLREQPDPHGRTHADLIFSCAGTAETSN